MSIVKLLDWLFPHRIVVRELEQVTRELSEVRATVQRLETLSRARMGRVARKESA